MLATKGWSQDTLQTPSQVAAAVLGDAPVVSLAGPALAAELLAGSPTGLLCASLDRAARRRAAAALASPTTAVFTTSDVAGAETAAAFKNVVAVAVGLAEGLSDRLVESALVASYANARAAVFARGMMDMLALVEAQGGRLPTVLGWPEQAISMSPASMAGTAASAGCWARAPRSTERSGRSAARSRV